MSTIIIGSLEDLNHTRYSISLSNGKKIVLFRLPKIHGGIDISSPTLGDIQNVDEWNYYAMEAECPHAGGPMIEAHIDIEDSSYIASCPWHAYDFNVETGESSYGIKTCTFPVTIHDGEVRLLFTAEQDVKLSRIDPVTEDIKFKHGSRTKANRESLPQSLGDDATLCDWCVHILNTPDPEQKIELTTQLFSLFATREKTSSPMKIGTATAPNEPPRVNLKEVKPGAMPVAGKGGSLKSRIKMLHALANIEQWAIDLAIDICVRFATFHTITTPLPSPSDGSAINGSSSIDGGGDGGSDPNTVTTARGQELPRTFYYDWLKVANDEAKHFSLLRARLEELGSFFGELPVHHGLWESATRTAHDLRARISVIALVHEARGLDVNPITIQKFRRAGDEDSAASLDVIHSDEITHVTTGHRWLSWICEQEGTDPVEVFRTCVQKHFSGAVKGPFNKEDRLKAGMEERYYEDLQGLPGGRSEIIAGG